MKVLDRARIKLATPGSADRHVSAVRHVTDCATRVIRIYRQHKDVTLFTPVTVHAIQLVSSADIFRSQLDARCCFFQQ